jgi:hypothetical protein
MVKVSLIQEKNNIMAKTAKQLLAEQNQKKIKSVKKRPKKQQESDDYLLAQSSNPDSYKKSKGASDEGTKPASKASSPMMRFCNGKSKPYSRKK